VLQGKLKLLLLGCCYCLTLGRWWWFFDMPPWCRCQCQCQS